MPATRTQAPQSARREASELKYPRACAFASARVLSHAELLGAPLRWPRPARLREPLELASGKLADGLQALGLLTFGELLEHLPRDSREARTVAALRPGEQATVAVQVRAISARAVRRRGMRPLVEASVYDATGRMRATFFNQPWLVERYPPGTRLLLHGKADERGGFRVSHHAPGSDFALGGSGGESGAESEAVAHYPAAEGVTSTQILTLVQGARERLSDVIETFPAATRVAERLPDRASALAAMHFPRGANDTEQGRRRLAFEELLLTQLVFLLRRARRSVREDARALAEPASLSERWLSSGLPFALTGDQRRAIEELERDLGRTRAMQRLLDGRGRKRQDGSRAVRDAARGRAWSPGRADGADRDARRAALRDAPAPDRRRAGRQRAADRLDSGPKTPGHPRQARQWRAAR